jgi:2-amino-4-hydroxy-6-hydroxymethyldihydropteridine diphosphokinase
MRAGIALGSNLGDKYAILNQAINQLEETHESGDFLLSGFHETEPMGCAPGTPFFLNAVAEIGTFLTPVELLHRLQSLEILSGRPKDHARNASRTLDLDLLYCDEMTLNSPELQLPHPRMTERLFVLVPLSEIRPNLKLSGWKCTCSEYLLQNRNK